MGTDSERTLRAPAPGPARIAALTVASLASCSNVTLSTTDPFPYTIEGVGVGSTCTFTDEFEDAFPCDSWEGVSPAEYSINDALIRILRTGDVLLGVASTKPLTAIKSTFIDGYQIDGTLAVLQLDASDRDALNGSAIEFLADDGTSATCIFGSAQDRSLDCDDWR